MKQLAMALLAAFLLTACAGSTPSAKVALPELPAELASTPRLQSVSSRVGGAADVGDDRIKVMWAQDRTVAAQCFRRHDALVSFYQDLRGNLQPE